MCCEEGCVCGQCHASSEVCLLENLIFLNNLGTQLRTSMRWGIAAKSRRGANGCCTGTGESTHLFQHGELPHVRIFLDFSSFPTWEFCWDGIRISEFPHAHRVCQIAGLLKSQKFRIGQLHAGKVNHIAYKHWNTMPNESPHCQTCCAGDLPVCLAEVSGLPSTHTGLHGASVCTPAWDTGQAQYYCFFTHSWYICRGGGRWMLQCSGKRKQVCM